MLKGIEITLINETQLGTDSLNAPIYEESEETVENVLVSPASTSDLTDSLNLYGKKAAYTLAIPKGDAHDWRDRRVKFFGKTWRTFGEPIQGIDALVPLEWNMKVQVEVYE